LPLVSRCYHF